MPKVSELIKGVKLCFINEPGELIFDTLLADGRLWVLDEFGFEVAVEPHLVMTKSGGLIEPDFIPKNELQKGSIARSFQPKGLTKLAHNTWEQDLHMEAICPPQEERLIDHPLGFQLKQAKKALEYVRSCKGKFLVLIHGKGTGKLREEVVALLRQEKNIKFWDDSFERYGGGAIRVELFGVTK